MKRCCRTKYGLLSAVVVCLSRGYSRNGPISVEEGGGFSVTRRFVDKFSESKSQIAMGTFSLTLYIKPQRGWEQTTLTGRLIVWNYFFQVWWMKNSVNRARRPVMYLFTVRAVGSQGELILWSFHTNSCTLRVKNLTQL